MVRRRRMGKVRCSQTEQSKFLRGWSLWKEGDGVVVVVVVAVELCPD